MSPGTGPPTAVLGAGNGGLALAGDLALRGTRVRLYEHPALADGFAPLRTEPVLAVVEGRDGPGRPAPLDLASHDLEAVVAGAPLVHLVVPVAAQERFFADLLELLREDQCLVVWAARFGGLRFRQLLRERGGAGAGPAVLEVNTLPYGCRRLGPREVAIVFRAVRLYAAGAPEARARTAIDELRATFPELRAVGSMLEAAFRNSALPVLGVGALLNMAAIESSGARFALFRDGMTTSVRRAIRLVHREMLAVGAALGFEIEPYPQDVYDGPASIEGANFRDSKGGLEGFALLTGPDRVHHRYTVENVRFGLVVIAALGEREGVATPVIRGLCALADGVCGEDFAGQGWSLADLGL